jgi:leucyl-tRNA synthetase
MNKIVIENTLPITVQVNGKLISKLIIDVDANDEDIRRLALADEYVKKFIEGKTIRKIIVANRKLVNIIV